MKRKDLASNIVSALSAAGHLLFCQQIEGAREAIMETVEKALQEVLLPDDYQEQALRTERTPFFIRLRGDQVANFARPSETSKEAEHRLARLVHGLVGSCTEAGEAQDAVKKFLIYGKPLDTTNVLEEAGDKLWYISLELDAVGFTMEQAMAANIAKLRARYGDKFSEVKALNRDEAAERSALEKTHCRQSADNVSPMSQKNDAIFPDNAKVYHTLEEANKARQQEWDPENKIDLRFRMMDLCGEVGEATNIAKKLERERMGLPGSRSTPAKLADELADVVICASLAAITENIDLQRAVESKFNATSAELGFSTRLRRKPTVTLESVLKAIEDGPFGDGVQAYGNRATVLSFVRRALITSKVFPEK